MTRPRPLTLLLASLIFLAACSSDPAQPKQPKQPKAPAQPEQPLAPDKPKQPALPKPPPKRVVENSLGMKFVWVPAGDFMMGSNEAPDVLAQSFPQYERKRLADLGDEAPVHPVRITRSFFLASMRSL